MCSVLCVCVCVCATDREDRTSSEAKADIAAEMSVDRATAWCVVSSA